jgi:hypothetical protein
MEHIQSFTQSHWMLPLVECLLRRIEFIENTEALTKHNF